jgi:serine/threonine-protein kinase
MDRDIGLKILPSAVASDQQRLHGFVQEARAAAALFHANVAHIYEIGEPKGTVNYMSPEQASGRRGVYSLGHILVWRG